MSCIDRIDKALYFYYKYMNKNYDLQNGKFKQYFKEHEYDEDDIEDELAENANVDDTDFINFDDNFPLFSYINNKDEHHKNSEIFRVLQHCYQHGFCYHIRLGPDPFKPFKITNDFPIS